MRHNLDKKRLLELTLAVYRVTAIFPISEESGQKIRDSADKILASLLLTDEYNEKCSRYINDIFGLFDLAEKKNWVDRRNFLVLRQGYEACLNSAKPSSNENLAQPSNNNRRERIIAALSGNGAVKISDFARVLPGINRRTILRDLDELYQDGTIIRNGHGRGVYYVKNATLSQ